MAGKGGRRAGAGRPPGSRDTLVTTHVAVPDGELLQPLAYLLHVLRDDDADVRRRDWAAGLLLAFLHERRPSAARLPPRERTRIEAQAAERTQVEDFAAKAAEVRARHGRPR